MLATRVPLCLAARWAVLGEMMLNAWVEGRQLTLALIAAFWGRSRARESLHVSTRVEHYASNYKCANSGQESSVARDCVKSAL